MTAEKFSMFVNDAPVELKSKETRIVMTCVATVETPISDSLYNALNNLKDDKGRKYAEFFAEQLISKGNPKDVIKVVIEGTVKGNKVVTTGTLTREQAYNRMTIAALRDAYNVTIVKTSESTETDDKGTKGHQSDEF